MANFRALALDAAGLGYQEVADTDTLLVGNVAPSVGNLTVGGAVGSGVQVVSGQILSISGVTGALNLTTGADLTAAAGSTLSGFDSIEGILSGNLVDKTATETITNQWTFQSSNVINPKLVVKAAGGEAANSLLFQVQTSAGSNLFSVDVEGDVVIAGGETVAGTTVYTGDITLGDGGNTVQVGSAATPAVGDNVYINTTGTVDGNFSITTTNFNVDTSGNQNLEGDLTFTNGGSITTTNNGDLTLTANGTGVVNATANLNASAGLDVSGAAITSSAGLTLTTTGITMTGLDIGTALARAGTIYCTSIDAVDLNSDGTNSPIWVVNEDAVAGTAENAAFISLAGDGGTELEAWQIVNNPSSTQLDFKHKTNPTNPKSLVEAGYTTYFTIDAASPVVSVSAALFEAGLGCDVTNAPLTVDANGIDCGGNIDLDGTLSFDGVAASIIDNSGTNTDLNITLGTGDLIVTAATVDLQTNVTTLDVPVGTGFSIGGVALTTANFTATNIDTLLDGSNADALHTHGSIGAGQLVVPGLTFTTATQYYSYYISSNDTVSYSVASNAGSFTSATFAGVHDAASDDGTLVMNGKVVAKLEAGLVGPSPPAPAAGLPVFLSFTTAGIMTTGIPASGSGHFMTRVGIILNASTYGATQNCSILIQPDRPVKR